MSQIVAATAEQFSRQIPLIECMYPGYRVKHWNIEQNHSVPRLFLELEPVGLPVCPRCRQPCLHIHDQKTRRVRDYSSLWGFDIFVEFPVRRVRCRCGCHRTERLSWVEPRARLTNQMISHLQYRLRSGETHKDLAESLHLSWDTIRVYDELMLKKVLRDPDFSRVENIAIDEFSIRKGHRYATIVIDVDVCKVLWVGMGKTINSVRPFFDLLRKAGADKRIKSVSCDMNAAYPRMVRENLPQAVITYDLFHVISNFTRDVLKEAKKAAQEKLRAEIDRMEDDEEKESLSRQLRDLKGSDWLMVRRKEDLKALSRRKFVEIAGMDPVVTVTQPELLELFVDYLESEAQEKPWPPLQLTLNQKKALVRLSITESDLSQDPPAWLAFFQKNNITLTAADWIKMQGLGWFINAKGDLFAPDSKKIEYFLLALRYEINLRGVL